MKRLAYIDRVLLFAVIQSLQCENGAALWRMVDPQKGGLQKAPPRESPKTANYSRK